MWACCLRGNSPSFKYGGLSSLRLARTINRNLCCFPHLNGKTWSIMLKIGFCMCLLSGSGSSLLFWPSSWAWWPAVRAVGSCLKCCWYVSLILWPRNGCVIFLFYYDRFVLYIDLETKPSNFLPGFLRVFEVYSVFADFLLTCLSQAGTERGKLDFSITDIIVDSFILFQIPSSFYVLWSCVADYVNI